MQWQNLAFQLPLDPSAVQRLYKKKGPRGGGGGGGVSFFIFPQDPPLL